MAWIMKTKSKRRLPARIAAGLALATVLIAGTFVASANAQPRRDDHRGGGRDYGDHRGGPGWHGGGYYAPPPVIYGGPAYYPPPVVYGPAVGIVVPGVSIGIQ